MAEEMAMPSAGVRKTVQVGCVYLDCEDPEWFQSEEMWSLSPPLFEM